MTHCFFSSLLPREIRITFSYLSTFKLHNVFKIIMYVTSDLFSFFVLLLNHMWIYMLECRIWLDAAGMLAEHQMSP